MTQKHLCPVVPEHESHTQTLPEPQSVAAGGAPRGTPGCSTGKGWQHKITLLLRRSDPALEIQ